MAEAHGGVLHLARPGAPLELLGRIVDSSNATFLVKVGQLGDEERPATDGDTDPMAEVGAEVCVDPDDEWEEWEDADESEDTTTASLPPGLKAVYKPLAGERPLGCYQGRTSVNTIPLTMAEGGFLYTADVYADELPYWLKDPHGPQLAVPYTLDANDMRFATPQGFNSGDQFFTYLKDAFDTLYAEGDPRGLDAPKMLSIGLHCRIVGRPGRLAALARFVDYARARDDVWFARRIDIARHWIATHPFEAQPA